MADDSEIQPPHPTATSADLLAQAEDLLAGQGDVVDAEGLGALLGLAVSHPSLGGQGSGEVVAELMMLVEQMQAGARADQAAVAIFLQAWRFLEASAPAGETKAALLNGLKTLRARYDQAQAA